MEELKAAKKQARDRAVADIERAFVIDALTRFDWNVSRAARGIGIQRTNLHALIKKYGITPQDRLDTNPPNGV
jgi:transcriptional regulator of acetoin/glycerol metabolism